MEITSWLADSVKNLFWFKNEHDVKEDKMFLDDYYRAKEELRQLTLRDYITKDEYLKWRDTWRMIYAKLSDESRFAKCNRKASRVGLRTSNDNILRVFHLRRIANYLLEYQKIARVIAEESYQHDRAALEVA